MFLIVSTQGLGVLTGHIINILSRKCNILYFHFQLILNYIQICCISNTFAPMSAAVCYTVRGGEHDGTKMEQMG